MREGSGSRWRNFWDHSNEKKIYSITECHGNISHFTKATYQSIVNICGRILNFGMRNNDHVLNSMCEDATHTQFNKIHETRQVHFLIAVQIFQSLVSHQEQFSFHDFVIEMSRLHHFFLF